MIKYKSLIDKVSYILRFIKIMLKRYHKPLLTFLGLIIFCVYFWRRFLRSRIPKELPLQLSLEGFIILSYIVFIFAYMILSLLFRKTSNPIIEKVIDILFIPIKELDKSIKNISFIKNHYENLLTKIFPVLEFLINKTDLFFIIFWVFPRILLLFVLGLDIFIYAKFEYRYKFIFIGLLLLFNRCFKYSLKNTKSQMYNDINIYVGEIGTKYYQYVLPEELEPDFDPDDEDEGLLWGERANVDMYLPLDVFIEHRVEYLIFKHIDNKYTIYPSRYAGYYFQMKYLGYLLPEKAIDLSKDKLKNYRTPFGNFHESQDYIYKKEKEYIEPKVHLLVRIAVLLEFYNKTSNNNKFYKILKVIIFSGYLICWGYVLIISYPNISMDEWNRLIMLLDKYKNILEKIW